MKTSWFMALMLSIVLSLVTEAVVLAAPPEEAVLAQKAAQAWVDRVAAGNRAPDWKGAVVTAPQPLLDLSDAVTAYRFSVAGSRGVVGYVVVGNSAYGYSIFEGGRGSPPAVPAPGAVKSAVAKIGIKVDEANIGPPLKLLYLGVDGFYAVYKIGGQRVGISLIMKKAVLVTNLKPTMPSPAEFATAKKAIKDSIPRSRLATTSSITGDGYQLAMSPYSAPGRDWCGPDSGVSIARYYRDVQGYNNLRWAHDENHNPPQ